MQFKIHNWKENKLTFRKAIFFQFLLSSILKICLEDD